MKADSTEVLGYIIAQLQKLSPSNWLPGAQPAALPAGASSDTQDAAKWLHKQMEGTEIWESKNVKATGILNTIQTPEGWNKYEQWQGQAQPEWTTPESSKLTNELGGTVKGEQQDSSTARE